MSTALILPPTDASFRKVAGLPVIQRAVLSVLRADFDRIVVVGREHTEAVRQLLRADPRTRGVEISVGFPIIEGDELTLVCSDSFITPATVAEVGRGQLEGQAAIYTIDGVDQLARCRSAAWANWAALEAAALSFLDAAQVFAGLRQHGGATVPIDGVVCVPISSADSARQAEVDYCTRMRQDSKASDGPLAHWLDRRISLRLSRWIVAYTGLRPNHITLIGTSLGLLASALLGVGSYATGVAGTFLFLITTIIDGCDGEVARMKFLDSSFGQKLDVTTDNVVHVTIFLGLAYGLYRADPEGPYLTLVAILLGGFAFDGALTYFFLVKRPDFASSGGIPITRQGRVRQGVLRGMEAMMNRDFAYLLLVLAIAGRLHWFVWGAAFGTYGFGVLLLLVYKWRDAA